MEIDIFERFPDMKPIAGPPGLSTVNGIGLTVYGRRDFDALTGTYVKTHWFALLFLPLVAVGAYRVADAPNGGWYFIGKVPLARLARAWSFLLVALILSFAGFLIWSKHTGSPEYQAKKKLREAEELREQGKLSEAAKKYGEVAQGDTPQSADAVRAIEDITANTDLRQNADPREMAGVFPVAWELRGRGVSEDKLFQNGLAFVQARHEDGPDACLVILDVIEPAAPKLDDLLTVRRKILERLTKERPGDLELLGKLAAIHEHAQRFDECEKLLAPHRDKLGVTEGARILGQIRSLQGKSDEAIALLQPYTTHGLKKLQAAELAFRQASEGKRAQLVELLKNGTAPGFDFNRANQATPDERQGMINDWLKRRITEDVRLARLIDAMRGESRVVNAAFALGMAQLRRGQQQTDPQARKAELEKAEKTFLSIKSQAGQSANFNLTLGEVYCWMGKDADGKKLFDAVLADDNRRFQTLMRIAQINRDLGDSAAARKLTEEAHNKPALSPEERYEAAYLRALARKDTDDEIEWLGKADPSRPYIKAQLASARGHRAVRKGEAEEAERYYKESLELYTSMPETSASLNNGAIVCQSLFGVTGDLAILDRGGRMQEKGLNLDPRNSIMVSNFANTSLGAALRGLLTDRLDLKLLRREGSLDLFSYLYADAAGRKTVGEGIRTSAAVTRTRPHFDRALVLAPKQTGLYLQLSSLYGYLDDKPAMRQLLVRAKEARIDLTALREEHRDYYQGKNDVRMQQERAAAVTRAEKVLAEARKAGGTTFAVAANALVGLRLQTEAFGPVPDLDGMVRLAEEAHQAAPSSATMRMLEGALLARAGQRLTEKQPEYAAMAKRARRSLGSTDLIALVLWREGKLRDAALADADVRRTLDLIRETWRKFPKAPTSWMWAMLRAAHPEEAAAVAQSLQTNEWVKLEQELTPLLLPTSGSSAFRACWLLDSAGKTKEAQEELKKCAAEGVPMPYDVR